MRFKAVYYNCHLEKIHEITNIRDNAPVPYLGTISPEFARCWIKCSCVMNLPTGEANTLVFIEGRGSSKIVGYRAIYPIYNEDNLYGYQSYNVQW